MLQTCCATRCWAHNVLWKEICVAWLVWKLWVVAKEMRALVKRAKGDIAHQFSWCAGRLCLLSVARWYANAPCRIWMILKPVLSCQQEIQEMFSTLGVMQLGQTYLSFANTSALMFEKIWTSNRQFFVGFRGGCQREEVRVGDFEDEDVDKMPRHLVARL